MAAIVGAAVGALHGASALPAEWVDDLSGRTAADGDHQIFDVLETDGKVFGYGCSDRVAHRASLRRASAGRHQEPVTPPDDLLVGELWVKVVKFLPQNWAVLRTDAPSAGARIWFIDDGRSVFDHIDYDSPAAARRALRLNGFAVCEPSEHDGLESPIAGSLASGDTSTRGWSPRRIYSSQKHWIDPRRG